MACIVGKLRAPKRAGRDAVGARDESVRGLELATWENDRPA